MRLALHKFPDPLFWLLWRSRSLLDGGSRLGRSCEGLSLGLGRDLGGHLHHDFLDGGWWGPVAARFAEEVHGLE